MISFVYFDVGGVAMLDFSKTNKWTDLKSELGVSAHNDELFEQVWTDYAWDVCLSRDVETLVPLLREKVGLNIPDNYSLLDGFIKRFEVNRSLWPVIHSLHKTTPIGLLTNMYPRMLNELNDCQLIPSLEWNAVIDSSVVGYQKPDKEIYEIAEKEAKVPASEILFVENTEGHIEVAKQRGWQTFLYDPSNTEAATASLISYIRSNNYDSQS